MRARVVKLYRDKNSKRYRKPGEIIKMSDERFEEINSTFLGIFLERAEDLDEEQENNQEPPAEEPSAEEPPAEEPHAEEPPAAVEPKKTTPRKPKK